MQTIAIPYCGAAPVPAELAARWNADPVLMVMLIAGFAFARSIGARSAPLLFALGVLTVLFVSPLCALSSALFSMRAAHHVVLTAFVAPLIAFTLPQGAQYRIAWTLAHAMIFWAWHTPQAYALALANQGAYWAMQASLLGSAVGLWRAIHNAPAPAGVAALLATMVQMGLLGALLTFAGSPLYDWHATTTQPWGLNPIEDQQLAGLIMWVPGAGLYLAAALWLANRWFAERQQAAAA